MTPGPKTATLSGRSSQSNTESLVTRRSPSAFHAAGYAGDDPVATTTLVARMVSRSSTRSVCASAKRARPTIRSSTGMRSTPSRTKPTKRSRSRLTRAITARPSTFTGPSIASPNAAKRSTACAASAGAISSLLGMQPTRAQVVP